MRWSLLLPLSVLIACKDEVDPDGTDGVASASSAAVLSVSSPERASWGAVGGAELTGNITDIAEVVVNGESHAVSGSSFAVPITLARGINTLVTEAVPADGSKSLFDRRSVIAGTFAPAEGDIQGAVAARVNRSGLDDVGEVVAGMVDVQSLNKDFSKLNPIVELDYGWGTGVTVDLVSVYFGAPLVSLIPSDGQITAEVILPELLVDTDATFSLLTFDTDQELELTSSYAIIRGDLALSLEDGRVVTALDDASVTLEEFAYDVSLIPGDFLEDNLFNDTIREAIEERLAGEMTTLLPELVASLQEDLDLTFQTELLGTTVTLGAAIADLGVDEDGVWLGMDVSVDAGGTDLSGEGYLTGGVAAPEPDRAADAAVLLSDDALNRALYELWLGGLLSQQLSTSDGSLSPDSLSSFGITEATITTDAGLPPVLVEQDGATRLQLGEVTVDLNTPSFTLGQSLVLRVAGSVGLDLSFADNTITPAFSDVDLTFDIIDTDWEQDREGIVSLLETFITPDLLLGAVDGLALELPSVGGVRVDSASIDRADSEVHTDLRIEISPD